MRTVVLTMNNQEKSSEFWAQFDEAGGINDDSV